MNLLQQIKLAASADFMGPGAIGVNAYQRPCPECGKKGGCEHRRIQADSSSSDIAHHHSWTDPSATDAVARRWKKEGEGRLPLFGSPGAQLDARELGGKFR